MVKINFLKSILPVSLSFFILCFTSCSHKEGKIDSADTTKVNKDPLKNNPGNYKKTAETIFICGDKEFSVKKDGDKVLISIEINGSSYKDHELKLNPDITSGTQYSDGKLTFWQKGNRCIVQYENKNIYEDCAEKNSK